MSSLIFQLAFSINISSLERGEVKPNFAASSELNISYPGLPTPPLSPLGPGPPGSPFGPSKPIGPCGFGMVTYLLGTIPGILLPYIFGINIFAGISFSTVSTHRKSIFPWWTGHSWRTWVSVCASIPSLALTSSRTWRPRGAPTTVVHKCIELPLKTRLSHLM